MDLFDLYILDLVIILKMLKMIIPSDHSGS